MIGKRRRLATAGAVLAVVAGMSVGITPQAVGQSDSLGGFTLSARGNAFLIRYDCVGCLAVSPLFETTTPESQTSLIAGPIGSATSSLGYPGPIIVGFEQLLAQSGLYEQFGFETPPDLPDYPIIATARTSGPNDVRDDRTVPVGVMEAHAEGAETRAVTTAGGAGSDAVLAFGGVRSEAASTATGTADSTASVSVSEISIADGLITIESVASELLATSDGEAASSSGGTTITGVNVLGLPAVLDEDGLRFEEPPSDAPTSGLGAIVSELSPLNQALRQITDQFGSVGELLAEAGITISLTEPSEVVDGAEVSRATQGVTIELAGNLSETELAPLFALIPLIDAPEGFPAGPSDLVQLLQSPHINTISIGRAEVSASATPPFDLDLPPFEPNIPTLSAVAPAPASPSPPPPAGTPPAAVTPAPPPNPTPSPGGPVPLSSSEPFALPDALGFGLIGAALLGAWLLSLGTRKLPDWALAGTAAGDACDGPIEGGSTHPGPNQGSDR